MTTITEEFVDVEVYEKNKFMERFQLKNLDDVRFVVNKLEILPPFHGMYFEEYDVDVIIDDIKFNFNITASKYEKENIIRKLRIKAIKEQTNHELVSCLNYLQRKRDLMHAINVLRFYKTLDNQRLQISTFLLKELPTLITLGFGEEGFTIKCYDTRTNTIYFKNEWTIWWNCRNFFFFDYINFAVNVENIEFYEKAKPLMLDMLKPTCDLKRKINHWKCLVNLVKEAVVVNQDIQHNHVDSSMDILSRSIEISDSENDDEVV